MMEEINNHVENLSKICRLCCKNIVLNRSYTGGKLVVSFKDVMLARYGVDVSFDIPEVHPTKLCNKCYHKLYRLKDKSLFDIERSLDKIIEFHPHSVSCNICSGTSRIGRPKSETKRVVNPFESIKLQAEHHGFYEFDQSSESLFRQSSKSERLFGTIEEGQSCLVNSKTIILSNNGTWSVKVYDKEVPKSSPVLMFLPELLNINTAPLIFSSVYQSNICPGNNDFSELIQYKTNIFHPKHFQSVEMGNIGLLQTARMESWDNFSVIRHVHCPLLTNDNRCVQCTDYRKSLYAIQSRVRRQKAVSEKTNDRYLSKEQLLDKVKLLEKEKRNTAARIIRIQRVVKQQIKEDGLEMDSEIHDILSEALEKEQSPFNPQSPQHLLWEQQKMQSVLNDKRGMRWHPLIIRWCLSIYLKSPSTYKHLRSSPFMFLPCKNTLLKYINFTEPGCGFNIDIITRLVREADIENLEDFQKNVCLVFDEMKIKSGLVFCKTTGKLVGFTEMGEINDEMERFGRLCESKMSSPDGKESEAESKRKSKKDQDKQLAKYVIVFMVRGLFTRLCYAFGHFGSEGFSSDQIFPCVLEAIRILESIGLYVRAVTADGASPNRKYFRLHKLVDNENVNLDGVVYWTWNQYCLSRKLYFICDTPHLVKTSRNNLENSHGNKKTRNLIYNKLEIGWHHVLSVYEWDLAGLRGAVGLRMGHKLREEHINLNPRSRMRVNLAAQVLSSTVANMLFEQGRPETKSTEKFLRMIDTFFDCLNVSKLDQDKCKRKPELARYLSVNDWRFEWLEKSFLGFLREWEGESDEIEGISNGEKTRFCLSKQTLEGLRITVSSFVALARELLLEGAPYLLSERLSQDPLEEYFSKQRARGGADENPTLEMFSRNVLGLNIAGDELIRVMNGNTRGRDCQIIELDVSDETRLPTKKHKYDN